MEGGSEEAYKHAQESLGDYAQNYIRVEDREKVRDKFKSAASSTSGRTGFWLTDQLGEGSKTPSHEQIHGWAGIVGHPFNTDDVKDGKFHIGFAMGTQGLIPNARVVTPFNIDLLKIPDALEGGKTSGVLGVDVNKPAADLIFYENRVVKYRGSQTELEYNEEALKKVIDEESPEFIIEHNKYILDDHKKSIPEDDF